MGVLAQQTPENQILPIAPAYPDLPALTKWAADLVRTLQQNLATIARKANDTSTVPLTGDLNAGGFSITNINNLGNIAGTITYKGADIDVRYVNTSGDTMTGPLSLGTNALSGVTTLAMGGALTGATTGTFSGAVSMAALTATTGTFAGALSGVTTISMGGALSGVTSGAFSGNITLTAATQPTLISNNTTASKAASFFVGTAGNVNFAYDSGNTFIFKTDTTANIVAGTVTGTNRWTIDGSGNVTMTAGLSGVTTLAMTGALSGATTGSFSGALAANGGITTTQTAASGATMNVAGNATSLAQNAEIVLSTGSGLLLIVDHTNGATGVVAVGGGTVSVIYAGPGTQYVNTSTPTTAQTGVYFSTTYRIRHGFAANHTYGVMWLVARNSN